MLLGYSESELLGMNMQQVTDPDDLPANLELFHRLTAGGPDFVIEKRYRRKDGSAVWTRVSVGGVREDGELRHILAVGLDISDRKRQEAELLALTHRQSLLYDLADVVNRAEALTGLYDKAIDTIIRGPACGPRLDSSVRRRGRDAFRSLARSVAGVSRGGRGPFTLDAGPGRIPRRSSSLMSRTSDLDTSLRSSSRRKVSPRWALSR
jgi:PAS domain S-box-containing protein